jgi:hypothetical protein
MSETVSYDVIAVIPDAHPSPIHITNENTNLLVAQGLLLGLLVAGFTIWVTRKLVPRDMGADKGFLGTEFSAALGITDGRLSGIPVEYKWIPVVSRRHPASLDLEFTVNNPNNIRLRVFKEGAFNKPLGALPPQAETPRLIESCGFVLRAEPQGAVAANAGALDKAVSPFCAAGLYEAILEGNKFSFSAVRNVTYEIEEAKFLLDCGLKAALLFN